MLFRSNTCHISCRQFRLHTRGQCNNTITTDTWPYRPEMQFSVFDLQRQQLQFTDNQGGSQLIDLTHPGENVLGLLFKDDLSYVDLFYDLLGSQYDPLIPFVPKREMVFSIGAEEA